MDEGRLPRLDDRDDLWAVLVTLTERKAFALADRETAAKRGGGHVRGDSIFGADGGAANVAAPDPTPAFAAEVAETCEQLLARIADHDPVLRDIAVWKLEGHTNDEVATRAGSRWRRSSGNWPSSGPCGPGRCRRERAAGTGRRR